MKKMVNIPSHDELIDRVKLEGDVEYFFDRACFDKITRDKLYSIGYLDAPASKGHHLSEPMGLARHSVNVTQWLVKLTNAGVVRWAASESPYRIGMLHDLVKCKCYAVIQIARSAIRSGTSIVKRGTSVTARRRRSLR